MPGPKHAAFVLVILALTGCGSSEDKAAATQTAPAVQGDELQVLATIDALQRAARKGNGRRICNVIFTHALARSIRASAKRSCAAEVRKRLFTPDESISVQRGIRLNGLVATAVVREQNGNVSTLHFTKQAGRWRIDRVTPQKAGSAS